MSTKNTTNISSKSRGTSKAGPTRTDKPGPLGRPSRLNREMIAAAAAELGLANVSPRTVAERLNVSVTGLYHYIDGRDDLVRLAAEYSAARLRVPTDEGQHWAVWVAEWAIRTRDVFIDQPELLFQLVSGGVETTQTAERTDTAVGFLVQQGFSIREANLMFRVACEAAVGAAVELLREYNAAAAGRPLVAEYHRVLALRPDELPYLRLMLEERALEVDTLKESLCVLLPAWAPEGEDPADVRARVAAVFEDPELGERARIDPADGDRSSFEDSSVNRSRSTVVPSSHQTREKNRP